MLLQRSLSVSESRSWAQTRAVGLPAHRQCTRSASRHDPKLAFTVVLPNYSPSRGLWRFPLLCNYSSHFSLKKWKWLPQFSARKPPASVFLIHMVLMGDSLLPTCPLPRVHAAWLWSINPGTRQEGQVVPQVGLRRLDFAIRVGKFGEKELVFFCFCFFNPTMGLLS